MFEVLDAASRNEGLSLSGRSQPGRLHMPALAQETYT